MYCIFVCLYYANKKSVYKEENADQKFIYDTLSSPAPIFYTYTNTKCNMYKNEHDEKIAKNLCFIIQFLIQINKFIYFYFMGRKHIEIV